ncbi:MAG: hypothetical protein HLX50_16730 [Alteromonadaceae bacterium]|nr:hypothetical protein [Alteromonadaceae bacterium]
MRKTTQVATALLATLTISLGSNAVASANPSQQSPISTVSESTATSAESLKASVEGVTPAAVVDRTIEEDEDALTETTTLDTGDVFTSVLDKSTNELTAYYNGEYVNKVNLDSVYDEMMIANTLPGQIQTMNWRCNTIEWLAYGNTAVWGIAAALFPPSVLAAAVGGTLTGAALLAAKQACKAKHG